LLVIVVVTLYSKYLIQFQGNKTFSNERLLEELGFEKPLWKKLLGKPLRVEVEKKFLPAFKEELESFYKEQGFWFAKIDVKIDEKNKKAIFIIHENDPILIKHISYASNFPIQELLPFKEGERFIIPKFIEFKEKVKQKLLEESYCSYEFSPKVFVYKKQKVAFVSIYLDKGDKCKIKKIIVKGLKTVPRRVILSHIYIKPGDFLDLKRIDESYKRLYSLQYFRSVRFDYSKKIDNQVFLELYLKERRKRNVYKAGIGYDTDRGGLLSLEYKHLNYHLHQPQISLFYSNQKQKIGFNDFYPSIPIFNTYYDLSGSLLYEYEKFKTFSQRLYSLKMSFLKGGYIFSYAFGGAVERYDIFDAIDCISNDAYKLFYPFATIFFDQRDSKIFPRSGFYLRAEGEITLVGRSKYGKFITEGGFFFPLKEMILFTRGRIGELQSGGDLPPSKYFVAGGVNSNRAYGYHTIYALDSDCQRGGKSLLETTVELRYPLTSGLYTAVFWDHTTVTNQRFALHNYVDGVGIGVLYPSPIGTIKAYFGVDPRTPSHNNLSLFIGASF